MNPLLKEAMKQAGDESSIYKIKRVAGGSINESYFVKTDRNNYFIKYHPNAPNRFFELEAKGLQLIKDTNTIDVPKVIAYSDQQERAYLVLEWVSGQEHKDTERLLGERLASMHCHKGDKHGFSSNTYVGTLSQVNGLYTSWQAYYRECRLYSQLELGILRNQITGKRRRQLNKLIDKLDLFVPDHVTPSYLHGDLWGGNWIVGSNGAPFLIDPSFLFGDRHFELAFTELFGGFSNSFYQAYEERFPVSSYYEDCKAIYQLYYLLVHLNIFGEMYGPHVDTILNKFVG